MGISVATLVDGENRAIYPNDDKDGHKVSRSTIDLSFGRSFEISDEIIRKVPLDE